MIAFKFLFANDPRDEAEDPDEPLAISVFAESEGEAWDSMAAQLSLPVDQLRRSNPTMQTKHVRAGEIALSTGRGLANLDEPWPTIVTEGIRDITNAITETAGATRKDRIRVELEGLKLDGMIMKVFSAALLASLAFAFYLITIDKLEPLLHFVFPVVSLVIGAIGGYLAGRGSAGRAAR